MSGRVSAKREDSEGAELGMQCMVARVQQLRDRETTPIFDSLVSELAHRHRMQELYGQFRIQS